MFRYYPGKSGVKRGYFHPEARIRLTNIGGEF